MKKFYLLCLICIVVLEAMGQKPTVVVTEDLVAVNGKNLFKVRKTKGGNMLLETMPELRFSICRMCRK